MFEYYIINLDTNYPCVKILKKGYTQINNLHAKGRYMVKTLFWQYLESVNNIGVNIPSYVVHEVWVSTSYPFQFIHFTILHVELEGKARTIEKDS